MLFAAHAFRRRQLMVRTPGEEPCFHILVLDIVAGAYLTVGLADFAQQPFLVDNIRLHGVRNKEIRTPT
jgi:hypothetical protein